MHKMNIQFIDGDRRVFRYTSDQIVYTERFQDGRLLAAAYQLNGIPVYEQDEVTGQPSFDLMIDGQSLNFGWCFLDLATQEEPDGRSCGIVRLAHAWLPVTLEVKTWCCGHGFFKRSLALINTSSDRVLGLTDVTPLQGRIWDMADSLAENLRDNSVDPFSVGHFKDFWWSNEGNFDWQDIPLNTGISYAARMGQSGHSHPFFVLRNNLYGGYFLAQMAWSANWQMTFQNDFFNDRHSHMTRVGLNFAIKPISPAPARLIEPGECVLVPEVHFGLNQDSLDSLIQNLHKYQRQYVLRQVGDGRQPVIYNQAGYMHPTEGQPDMSEAGLKQEVDIAAAIGAELFMVDAGWYSNLGQKWYLTTGDWQPGNCLPDDLFPVYAYAREKGLKCGLWVEIESAGRESVLAREHPDWFIERYGHSVERVLDLAKPEVQNYVEAEIIRLIERYQLDMFRLDYNLFAREGGFNLRHQQNENTLWRHQEAIYGIFDRIGRRYPDLQLENCASGGGRTDLGMVSRFTTTWISDWMKLPRTVRIFNGLSMALPPEYLNRCFGVCMDGAWRGNTETQIQTAIMGHPTFLGIAPTLAETNPELMALIDKYVRIYKTFIRPFHREALVYHHTPVIQGADGIGWCAWEYVSLDQKRAVAVVFRLLQAPGDEYRLCFRGLAGDRTYQVTQEPGGRTMMGVGADLLQRGITVRLETALTSQMLLLQAEE